MTEDPNAPAALCALTEVELADLVQGTVGHYQRSADSFWQGTRGHDVSQNIAALLRHLPMDAPCRILDLGCGPGRDLVTFKERGHEPVGLDGALAFVTMAREHSGCEVLHQSFLALDLPPGHFHGVFANAVLFHVPSQELHRVLTDLHATLADGGVLFVSNPRGPDSEGWRGTRYGSYLTLATWRDYAVRAGFEELEHYYRPPGAPRDQQPWLATVWRKAGDSTTG